MHFIFFRLCLQYSFLPFISRQLDDVRTMWNCHLIRPQKKGDTVAGIPEILHSLSEIQGADNYKTPTTQPTIQALHNIYHDHRYHEQNEDFVSVANELSTKLDLPSPESLDTFEMCKHHYHVLNEAIKGMM